MLCASSLNRPSFAQVYPPLVRRIVPIHHHVMTQMLGISRNWQEVEVGGTSKGGKAWLVQWAKSSQGRGGLGITSNQECRDTVYGV